MRGRGQQGARTPLLWDEGQVEDLLQGSPVVMEVRQRMQVRTDRALRAPKQHCSVRRAAQGRMWPLKRADCECHHQWVTVWHREW